MINPQLINMLFSSPNPDAMMQQVLGNNPIYQQIMQNIQGKSPEEIKQYAMNVCRTQGIDINSLAKQFNIPLW